MSVFYLGAHQPHWLWQASFPLFVSHRQLARRRGPLRRASCRWALDSGGFTELSLHGRWITPAAAYAEAADRYAREAGRLDFAAPQDWMCEPAILAATGLSVREHQERTIASYLQLRDLAPHLPFIPVVQGWHLADYLRCVDLYRAAGVDLAAQPLTGLGSVCRRQSTGQIAAIVTVLANAGLNLHGFGIKTLADHRGDRKAWLLDMLGLPDSDDTGRYRWELVTPGDADFMTHGRRMLHVLADRVRWQAALAEAKRRAEELSATGRAA